MSLTKQIEEKWQAKWEISRVFEADPDPTRQKIMVTFPYPYMNGPLHVGHTFTASRVDAYARFKRMQGYNVLWPWGWHWTGQPLLGASQRVARNDEVYIRVLREVDGVPDAELKKFVDPLYMAQYYTNEGRLAAKRIGFSVDWRREFTTILPTYQKFIEWQYKNLQEKGYVTRGTHPVVWCPKDQSPTGDHDRQVGEGVTPEEYTLIKYRLDENTILPAATFRPETVYGITNIWVNPDATYVEAQVNKENWIISQEASEKLKEQQKTVQVKRTFKGRELIGKTFENPVTKKEFPILPGWFVDPKQATGIVYSVPAHAPYDWLALKDLKEKPEVLKDFGVDPEVVKKINPISIIKVEGFGEFPAVEIVQQMGIKDQHDPRADQATKELYKKEFHGGKLKQNCGVYAGKSVREVKDTLIGDFRKLGVADSMYDLPEPVICRCMTQCIVKILSNQWFLNYSDPQWKAKAKEVVAQMTVYPDSAKPWFNTVIDWLREWACARTTGFGTPLPWEKGWIIETLSDSTVYMAFYTINKLIKQHNVKPEALTPEVFDYVFYDKGEAAKLEAKTGLKVEILNAMQSEFKYWYPFDLRVSAKELVPNHLSFCIFHHAALFPQNYWPRGIGVNGMLMVEGKQMHKSKGNFVTMKGAVDKYGADATRCALLLGAEGMDDPDWRSESAADIQGKIESFYNFALSIIEKTKCDDFGHLEKWLLSRLQHRISEVTKGLDELKTRTALEVAFFETWNDFRWYTRRKGRTDTKAVQEALEIWVRLVAPFAPHISEELWSKAGKDDFISRAAWPTVDENKLDWSAEEEENFLIDLIEDTLNVLKATKITPKKICYYTAAAWKTKIYTIILEKSLEGEAKINDVMKNASNEPELKQYMKQIAALVPKILKTISKLPTERKKRLAKTYVRDEKEAISASLDFLKTRFEADVAVYSEEDATRYDPRQRATMAVPRQPAIFIE